MSTNDIMTTGRMRASYETGRISGEHRAEKQARIAAFGAIRKAAVLARRLETDQDEVRGDWHAYYIRCAIRQAIGSKKES